ncbi:hypothetical protein [Paraburkholderia kirstenboschensis]|uniref:Uncharacterized protein n=1 Tax=Paraburkholderia kirstenboschensis TaxID=1245436 RepID=A0ABZ0EC89_9BURK|nr:hypothetical protein [Paraburkholderia kirstenboschensis]WOD14833.1 hypothetical protein RW095_15885 [Paraburkholderia kirstenboschensis]
MVLSSVTDRDRRAVSRAALCKIQLDRVDHPLAANLLPVLERRTGRIVINAFAHPREVSYASIHGGPFPATSDSRFFCYQGLPDELLPEALQRDNPRGIWRLTDGQLSLGEISQDLEIPSPVCECDSI